MDMDLWTYEREQWNHGFSTLCGVDEAGAGPLAGPVYAAAVILPREIDLPGLNDSKKLTPKKREALFDQITAAAEAYSIAFVTAEEIDQMDILNARMLAMQRAIGGLSVTPDLCLIDGNRDHGSSVSIDAPHVCLVGGDGKTGTGTSPTCWTGSTPSTSSPATRATGRSSTMPCWTSTAPVRPIGGRS